MEQQQQDQAQQTGTRNETYDVIAVLYHALQGAENCQIYARDAQDERLRHFFHDALSAQRQLADQGKEILQRALEKDSGQQNLFGLKSRTRASETGDAQSSATDGQTNPEGTF